MQAAGGELGAAQMRVNVQHGDRGQSVFQGFSEGNGVHGDGSKLNALIELIGAGTFRSRAQFAVAPEGILLQQEGEEFRRASL